MNNPPGLLQGAAFQYLNPKAYIMSITAMSLYPLPGEQYLTSSLFIMLCFFIITPFSISLWAGFGSVLRQWMDSEKTKKIFHYFLGGLTAGSVLFILL